MSDVDAVLFDLDSTLCVREQDDDEIHARVFDRVGVEPFFEPADLYALDTDDLPPADSDREHFEHVYRVLADAVGGDPSLARSLAEATVEVVDYTHVSFRDGAERALARAREECAVALVTNGSEETQTTKLEALGIADAFDVEVYCGPGMDVPAKPNPEPLAVALDELGVAPGDALKVGNSLALDVAAAHAAGMEAAWVPVGESEPNPDPTPTHVFDSMTDVAALFRE